VFKKKNKKYIVLIYALLGVLREKDIDEQNKKELRRG